MISVTFRKRTAIPLPLAGGVRGGLSPQSRYQSIGTSPPLIPPASGGEMPAATFFLRLVATSCLFFLSACGFHSVYSSHGPDGSPVAEQLSQVGIDPIQERAGQMLRNDLIDRFYGKAGRPSQPRYHLAVALRVGEEDIGTLANATTVLAAVHLFADYALKDANGKTLVHGTTSSTTQYDRLTSDYATLATHDAAIERAVREVSEQLTARLGLYFAENQPLAASKHD